MKESQIVEDLVLLLLYLHSWEQKVTDKISVVRSWKGYSFDVLDILAKK